MNFLQKQALKYTCNFLNKELKSKFKFKEEIVLNKAKDNKKVMLYIHVPFCHTFCPYCSFHKFAYDEELCKEYFKILRVELQQFKDLGYDFNTLYVGGGTTLINEDELIKTLSLCKDLFSIEEISCESDPNHIKPEVLKDFKGLIDRLSCGVQSFDNDILRKVNRLEKFGEQKELVKKLELANGILPTFSIDLIFNFPSQTKQMLIKDIELAKSIAPSQITLYPLMKSNLTKEIIAAKLGIDKQDNEYEFYKIIYDYFSDYEQNNSWSFSKDRTNFNDEYVSTHHEYIGAGSGAFSFTENKLLVNAFKLDDYKAKVLEGKNKKLAHIDFSNEDVINYIFLTEFFKDNLNINNFNQNYNCDLEKHLGFRLKAMKSVGAININNGIIQNTFFGKYLALTLMKEFYINMDLVRAFFRKDL